MRHLYFVAAFTLCLFGLEPTANGQLLGSAGSFAVLAGAAVTNTGPTALVGDLGVGLGGTISGFPPGTITGGSIHSGDPLATAALSDSLTAFNVLAGETFTQDLTGQNLGGMTLHPGVYHFSAASFLTGTLTLDAGGDPNARFDFQIGSTLISSANAAVQVINDGSGDNNVYWAVGSSATLATDTDFVGHILAGASVTLNLGTNIVDGSAFAQTGAVTMATNSISPAATPEPTTIVVLGVGGLGLFIRNRPRHRVKNSVV